MDRTGVEHGERMRAQRRHEGLGQRIAAQHDRRALAQEQQDRDDEMEAHGEHPSDDVVPADIQPGVGGLGPGEDRFVRQHDAFAGTGGAGRKADEGRPEIGIAGGLRAAGRERGEPERPFQVGSLERCSRRGVRRDGGIREEVTDVEMFEQRRAFVEHQSRRNRHDGRIEGQDRQREQDVVDAVRAQERHAVEGPARRGAPPRRRAGRRPGRNRRRPGCALRPPGRAWPPTRRHPGKWSGRCWRAPWGAQRRP